MSTWTGAQHPNRPKWNRDGPDRQRVPVEQLAQLQGAQTAMDSNATIAGTGLVLYRGARRIETGLGLMSPAGREVLHAW